MTDQDMFWPKVSKIEFKNVAVKRDGMDKLLLDIPDCTTASSDRIKLIGTESDGIQTFKSLFVPYIQNDNVEGCVLLDGRDLRHVPMQCRSYSI